MTSDVAPKGIGTRLNAYRILPLAHHTPFQVLRHLLAIVNDIDTKIVFIHDGNRYITIRISRHFKFKTL